VGPPTKVISKTFIWIVSTKEWVFQWKWKFDVKQMGVSMMILEMVIVYLGGLMLVSSFEVLRRGQSLFQRRS